MYYPFFALYIVVGLIISLVVVYWALKNGQFREQQRARYLPLEEETEQPTMPQGSISSYEIFGLLGLASAGLLASGAILVFSLLTGGFF